MRGWPRAGGRQRARGRSGYMALVAASAPCWLLAAAWTLAQRPALAGALVLPVAAALVLAGAGALASRPALSVAGAGLLGLVFLAGRPGPPTSVLPDAAFGCLLVLSVELDALAADLALPARWPPGVPARRALTVLATVGVSLPLAWGVGEVGLAGWRSGPALAVLGGAAAVMTALLLARLARR